MRDTVEASGGLSHTEPGLQILEFSSDKEALRFDATSTFPTIFET